MVHFDLRQTEVNEQARSGVWVVQEVCWLDVPVHHTNLCQMTNSVKECPHVVLHFLERQLRKVGQMRLRLLVFEYERDLTLEAVTLDQVCNVPLAIKQFENQHLQKNECGINSWEDSLDRVLLATGVLISIVLIISYCFENDTVRS